jgi:hypothetical protein
MVWGIFAVLVVTALGVGAAVRQAAEATLSDTVSAGPLAARVPKGWNVSRELIPPRILARGEDEGVALVLDITLRSADGPITPRHFIAFASGGEVLEMPRAVDLGGRKGELFVYEKRIAPGFLIPDPVIATAIVAEVDEGTFIHVELERFGDWNPSDAVLVQQVARTVQVAPLE